MISKIQDQKVSRDPLCGIPISGQKDKYKLEMLGKTHYFCSEYCKSIFAERPRIAYFSMEIALKSNIPTYSGGLGVLAGDTIRSSADLRIPLIAITLVSKKGYLKQEITSTGEQVEHHDKWDPSQFADLLPVRSNVKIGGKTVSIQAWIYEHKSLTGGVVPTLFLDTDVSENATEDRKITDVLYGGDNNYRLKQEIVLGVGGIRLLKNLNMTIRNYHMNEGHSSLLTLELLKDNDMNPNKVRDQCIFTTHTPVEAAFDKFDYNTVRECCEHEFPVEIIKKYGGNSQLNTTLLALNLSKYINGVTKTHMEFSKKLFPGYHIRSITNGVHSYTWTCPAFRKLFDKYIQAWANEPELLVRADSIPNDEIWKAHIETKKVLINFVLKLTGEKMNIDSLTIGFARRATSYKRAMLIFQDLQRLTNLSKRWNIQLLFAGKAHPKDTNGKEIIKQVFHIKKELKNQIQIIYLPDYDLEMASKMVSGVDVWLNTPLPPFEASGTSGMKAAHNGVINFSVLDGWWIEGCIEGITGWSIGPQPNKRMGKKERERREIQDLYNKLEYLILPTYYQNRDEWIEMMENSIAKIAYYFNSHRMMRRYVTDAYFL